MKTAVEAIFVGQAHQYSQLSAVSAYETDWPG
jgi:hypothetical protein